MKEGPMRVLVCGGRDFDDGEFLGRALDALAKMRPFSVLIQGGATGADALARTWALHHSIPLITEPADWNTHGRKAGPIRNQKMLDMHKPDVVVAFRGGKGTADMIRRAKRAGITVVSWDADTMLEIFDASSVQPETPDA
jgi:hypothetical protein